MLKKEFILAEGVPELVQGMSEDTTEAASKMVYLSFEQFIKANQFFVKEVIKMQLGIDITIEFPASIAPSLLEDQKKDGNNGGVTPPDKSDPSKQSQ